MNEILVGLDFSASSLNALEHAMGLASKYKAFVLAVWVETKDSFRFLGAKNSEDATRIADEKIAELKESFKDKFPGIEIQFVKRKGSSYKEILSEASEIKPDMIITGTHTNKGLLKFFMGEVANSIYANADCPVISIAENRTTDRSLKTILMPVDNSLDTRQKVPLVSSIAKKYGAEVHVLGMITSSIGEERTRVNLYVKQVMAHFYNANIPCTTKMVEGSNPVKKLLTYANSVDANLVAIMVKMSGDSDNPFVSSKTQQLINQAPMPILTVPNKEIMSERPGR